MTQVSNTDFSSSATDSSDSRLSGLALWQAIRKNWPLVVVLALLVSCAVAFYTIGQTKIYEAEATIMFDPRVPQPLGDKVGVVSDDSSYWNNKEYYKTQHWMIQSMRVASQVVRDLELDKDAGFISNNLTKDKKASGGNVEESAQALTRRLSVEQVKDSRLTSVKFRDADPLRAQRVLGALVDAYAQDNLDDVFESATMAADWLRSQVGTLRSGLESSEMALHDYKSQKNILSVSMDDQSNMLRGEMTQLNQAVTEVKARREKVAARLAELRKIQPENPTDLPALELIENPALQELRAQFVDAQRVLSSLGGSGLGDNHPQMAAATASSDTIRRALLGEVRNIQGAHEHELAALEREAAGLKGLYDNAERRALDLNLLEIEYNRLKRAKETNEKLFSLVIERSKETDLTRMLRVNNVRVVDRPLLPKKPITPNVPLNIAGGIMAGLLFGLVAAIGRDQLDRTLKMPDHVEQELGVPLLGIFPQLAATQAAKPSARRRHAKGAPKEDDPAEFPAELVVNYRPTSGIAEAARAIRTNIVFMSPDTPHRTILVTSAAPSEGKTTVACGIATTMAQAGQRVVLVDCDLRRPRLHKVFRRSNDWGMTTALLDPTQADSIAFETEVENLWIVPTGPIPPNPAELLHSEVFKKLLARLRERFDRVIVDSPPIVPVTDATILSTQMDGVILVVRASQTTKDLARRAVKSLRDVSSRIVGVVFNAVDLDNRNYAGYQYYYYRREGYGAEESTTRKADAPEHVGTA